MTQNKDATLLDSIQSEVSKEATPMLDFLIKNARKIFAVLIALILLIVIFGGWSWYSGSKQRDSEEALGKIVIMQDTPAKLSALEEFAQNGPKEMKPAALLALAQSATLQNQFDKAIEAWQQVAAVADAPTRLVAGMSEANLLIRQGKGQEALDRLEAMLATTPTDASPLVYLRIMDVAESLDNWDKAISACDALLRQATTPDDRIALEQRMAYFIAKK